MGFLALYQKKTRKGRIANFAAASKFAGKPFQQRIWDSHSLLEFAKEYGLQR